MNVVVTGGSGRIGRYVVRELAGRGHEVLNLDTRPGRMGPGRSLLVDLLSSGEVYQALAAFGADAVVHLAAWAGDGFVPSIRTYRDNSAMTFNLLQASADLDVRRVICASSHHVYGTARYAPAYVPLDEEHPIRPVSAYGLSKLAGEQVAEYFTRVRDLEVLSFRFVGVRTPDEMDRNVAETEQHPERNLRLMWTRMDARDAAGYCRAAMEAPRVDSGAYNISSRRILLDENSADLVARHFGEGTEIREGLDGRESPMSSAKARFSFDYVPQYEWSVSRRFPE